MAEISGVPTADIDNVDGFFTTQGGGGGLSTYPLTTGAYMSGGGVPTVRPDMTYEYLNYPITTDNIVELTARNGTNAAPQIWGRKSDGTLWYYFLSTNSTGGMTVVIGAWTQYGTDTDWEKITSGYQWNMAIKGGDLYACGYSNDKAHGYTTAAQCPVWTLINSSETWVDVSCGATHTVALTSTGKVFAAGNNGDYRTMQNTASGDTTSFTQEHTLDTWDAIAAGNSRSLLVKAGNIYSSGRNSPSISHFTTSTADLNGPVLTYSGGDIVSIAFNTYSGTAIDTSGSLRFAGYGNSNGRLDGSTSALLGTSAWGAMGGIGADTDWTKVWTNSQTSNVYQTAGIKGGKLYATGTQIQTYLRLGSSGGLPNNGTPREINGTNTFNGGFVFMYGNMVVSSFS